MTTRAPLAPLTLAILLGFTPLHAQDMSSLEQSILQSTKALADELLPPVDVLDGDWRLPWEIPEELPAYVESEDEWWIQQAQSQGPSGIPREQATQLLEQQMGMLGEVAAESGMSLRDVLVQAYVGMRVDNGPPELAMLQQYRAAAAAVEIAQAMQQAQMQAEEDGDGSLADDGEASGQDARRKMLEIIAGPYAGMDEKQLKQAMASEATLVEQRTGMSYYLSNDWDAHVIEGFDVDETIIERKLWVGIVDVRAMLVYPDRLDDYPDLDAEGRARLQSELQSLVGKIAGTANTMEASELEKERSEELDAIDEQIARETDEEKLAALYEQRRYTVERYEELAEEARAEAAMRNAILVQVYPRDFGEHCYVVRMSGFTPPDAGNMEGTMYSAWLRNGSAVAGISIRGNVPVDRMDAVMDMFLDEMDAATQPYGDF